MTKNFIMQFMTANSAKQQFGTLLDSVQHQPVTIRRQNRDVAVLLSLESYQRLKSENVQQLQQFCDRISGQARSRGLTEEKLDQLLIE